MSGGHFDYQQYRLNDIVSQINEIILFNGTKDWYHYSEATLAKFREAIAALKKAEAMVQRIDWLHSGDDSEESFHKRWEAEVE